MPPFRNTATAKTSGCDVFRVMQNSLFNYRIIVSIIGVLRLFLLKEKIANGRKVIDF